MNDMRIRKVYVCGMGGGERGEVWQREVTRGGEGGREGERVKEERGRESWMQDGDRQKRSDGEKSKRRERRSEKSWSKFFVYRLSF